MLKWMFATNNHHPELVSRKLSNSKRFLVGRNPRRTECSITFRTDRSEYKLQRCFLGNIQWKQTSKIGTSITYHGQDVIQVLSKFHKPFIVGDSPSDNSSIKPIDNYRRSAMVALANNWARMIGHQDSRIDSITGRWSTPDEYDFSISGGALYALLCPHGDID